jgi:hypothetical protein
MIRCSRCAVAKSSHVQPYGGSKKDAFCYHYPDMREVQDIIDELKALPIPAQLGVVGALAQNLEASLSAAPRCRLAPDGSTWVEWISQSAASLSARGRGHCLLVSSRAMSQDSSHE